MSESVRDYIERKGFRFKCQAGQIVLQTCPYCGDEKSHFYMSQEKEGVFFCQKCNAKGNLRTLQRHLGDRREYEVSPSHTQQQMRSTIVQAFPSEHKSVQMPDEGKLLEDHRRLLGDDSACDYLIRVRGLGQTVIEHFRLGLEVDGAGTRWLAIPHYAAEKLINVKYRTLPPAEKAFRRTPGCRSILFNSDAIELQEEVFITEGEIDAMTLWCHGITNVVGVTAGAGSFDSAWVDQLAKIYKIYLVYDPDDAGQKGAREVARRLGYDRCFNILLPDGLDVNDYFLNHNISDFRSLVQNARQFDVAGIVSVSEGLRQLKAELHDPERIEVGLRTGWADVDRLLPSGLRPGELVVLSAPPKTGKTSFALQVSSYNVLQGIPALMYCLEMTPKRLTKKVAQSYVRNEIIGDIELSLVMEAFEGEPLYFGYSHRRPKLDDLIDTLKAAVRRYGLKLVVFDNLHSLCRSITNQTQEVGLAVQEFKFLADEMEIPVILIAQPRKIQPDTIMTAMDLKDSVSIFSDCDHLIILHRNRLASAGENIQEDMLPHDQAYDPLTLVRVEASRYSQGGEALLYFHGACSWFEEVPQPGK